MSEHDPFRRTFDELEQVRIHYNNLHTITSRVSKLLGDCKFGNIERELKKALEGKDAKALELEITDLKGRILVNHDEIEELRNKVKSYDLLQNAIGAPGDVVNKARLFDENIRTDGRVSTSKITKVLVTFTRKMDEALAGMRELFSRGGSYPQPTMPPPTATPHKEKPLSEVKTPQQQRIEKDGGYGKPRRSSASRVQVGSTDWIPFLDP